MSGNKPQPKTVQVGDKKAAVPRTVRDLWDAGLKVAVGIPMGPVVDDWAFLSFWDIARKGWPLLKVPYDRPDVNRNKIGLQLLESEFTHVVMLDLDHTHPSDVVERLLRWPWSDPEKLVVGGLSVRRCEPFEPTFYLRGPDGLFYAPVDIEPGLIEVARMGHGAVLISRQVLETIPPPWWRYTYTEGEAGHFSTEDFYFCARCEEYGIKLWVDTTCHSPHIRKELATIETFRAWIEKHPEKVWFAEAMAQSRAAEVAGAETLAAGEETPANASPPMLPLDGVCAV
jgi:hypothetical protein